MRSCYCLYLMPVLLIICCFRNTAAVGTDLPDLALKHRNALGGESAIRAISTARFVSNLQIMMLKGTIEEVYAAPDKLYLRIKTPVMEQTQGESDNREWKLDQNGQIVTSDFPPVEGSAPEAVIPMFQYLFAGAGFELHDAGIKTVDAREFRVLEVTDLSRNKSRRLLLNPDTYLAEIVEEEEDGIPITTRMSDFREVSGIQIPFTTVQTINMEGLPETHISLNSAEFNVSVPPRLFDPPVTARHDFKFPENKSRHMIDLTRSGDHLFTPVQINGKGPYMFLLDSGAASSILNRRLTEELGLDVKEGMTGLGVGGPEAFGACQIESMDIQGVVIHDLKIYAGNLDAISSALGLDIQGILGYDLFARVVVKLDIRASLMTLIDATEFQYSGDGEIFQGEIIGGLMHIKGTLDGQWNGLFRVDTGASGALHLHSPFVNANKLVDHYVPHIETQTLGAGGRNETRYSRANQLDLGTFTFDRPVVTLQTSETSGALAMRDSIGTIGNDIWSRFIVYFDYPRKRLILEANPDFKIPLHLNRSGIAAAKNEDALVVTGVIPGSPAFKKGILSGDRIVAMNSIPISSMSFSDWHDALDGEPGTKVKLSIERNNKQITRTLRFKDYL